MSNYDQHGNWHPPKEERNPADFESKLIDRMELVKLLEKHTEARKQAQADLERYKARCTELERINEALESWKPIAAQNAELRRLIAEVAIPAIVRAEQITNVAPFARWLNRTLATLQEEIK